MIERLIDLQLKMNERWSEMTDTQQQDFMNKVFEIAITNEKANDSAFKLMSDIYDQLKEENVE